jgi:phosphoglucomutase
MHPVHQVEVTCLLQVGTTKFGDFEVEVVDEVEDYLATLKEVFDFPALKVGPGGGGGRGGGRYPLQT